MSNVNNEIIISDNLVTEKFSSNNIIDPDVLATERSGSVFNRIDNYTGYHTTQQIKNKDFSKFKNHVYFDSAVDKVSYAFQDIIEFPFDKDESVYNKYKSNLSGYTNWILKNEYPKNKGYIQLNRNGYVKLINKQGNLFDDHPDKGFGILNPRSLSGNYAFNFWIRPYNDNTNLYSDSKKIEVVFQKYHINTKSGFICYLKKSSNNGFTDVSIGFKIINSTFQMSEEIKLFSKTTDTNNEFYNIAINVLKEKNSSIRKINFYVNGNLVENENSINFGSFDTFSKEFQSIENQMFISTPNYDEVILDDSLQMLRADLDEFRFFQTALNQKFIKKYMKRNIFSSRYLALYLKFNEPAGEYTNSNVIIDYSGNKAHGLLLDSFGESINNTAGYFSNLNNPMTLEKLEDCPIINASYSEISTKRDALIREALKYDEQNINCIFKLFPKHFFVEAGKEQKLPVYANSSSYKMSNTLAAIKPANNHFVNILLIWARFFDQLKMYIDAIGFYDNVNYDELNKEDIIGIHLVSLCKSYGFDFKEILSTITKDQLDNLDLLNDDSIIQKSIRDIQNKLWYRILLNSQDILRSKGTRHSIHSAFNAAGINANKYIDIVEQHSYNNINNISSNTKKIEKFNTLNFGHNKNILTIPSGSDFYYTNKPVLIKDVNQISTNNNYTLNNNWTIEGYFNFNDNIDKISNIKRYNRYSVASDKLYSLGKSQSLFKLAKDDNSGTIICHVYYEKYGKDSNFGKIIAKCDKGSNSFIDLVIENINLYECGPFYIGLKQSYDNSSVTYSLYFKKLDENITKDSIKKVDETLSVNNLNKFKSNSDLKIIVGQVNFQEHNQPFYGEVLNLRLWNNIDLSLNEIYSHSSDINNIGLDNHDTKIKDYLVYNFMPTEISNITPNNSEITLSDTGTVIKYSNVNNDFYLLNSVREVLYYYKSLKFDQPNKENRVDIIAYEEASNKEKFNNFTEFPSYNVPDNFEYDKENRVSIEMSVAKKINEDIEKITSDIESFSNLIIQNQALYAKEYYNLKERREKYFEKYSQKDFLNYSSLGNVFKFFDNIMTSLLDDLVSSKIINRGFNLIYESHILERNKYQHKNGYSTIPLSKKDEYYLFSKEIPDSYRPEIYNERRKRE